MTQVVYPPGLVCSKLEKPGVRHFLKLNINIWVHGDLFVRSTVKGSKTKVKKGKISNQKPRSETNIRMCTSVCLQTQIYTQTLGTNVASLLWLHSALVPSTPICLFFNLAKLQCKQTVVTDFCIGFVNKIHIIGKGVIKETWIAKSKEIGCWMIKELITFCPFSPVSAWSKKLQNFAVKHVDLSWDFGHDVLWLGRRIDVNNEGGLDTRPSSLYWQIEPGVFLA